MLYVLARPLHYEWVKLLFDQCVQCEIPFRFFGTGDVFVKDGKEYRVCKAYQAVQALRSRLQYPAMAENYPVQKRCANCSRKNNCNGCNWCGECLQR